MLIDSVLGFCLQVAIAGRKLYKAYEPNRFTPAVVNYWDLHKTKAVNIPTRNWNGPWLPTPNLWAMDSWGLLEKGESVFFKGAATGMSTTHQGWSHIHEHMGTAN